MSPAECNRGANQDENNLVDSGGSENDVFLAECNRGANEEENKLVGSGGSENDVSLAEFYRGSNQDENNLAEKDQPVYHPIIGSAEFEFDQPNNDFCEPIIHPVMGSEFDERLDELHHLPEESKQIQRIKAVKTDEVVECLICHITVKRIDRHLKQHREKISDKEERFLIDFYRTRNAPGNKKVYDCLNCYRSFVSLVTHRYKSKFDCTNVVLVENCASRR